MKICVYGASSASTEKSYIKEVEELGREIGRRGDSLIFGGGADGLMGAAARGVHETGGKILGIAPKFFNVDGVLFENCTEFAWTNTMHERKKMMEDTSDAFIITPGGIGTFEEFFEALTLKQLGRHNKPIVIFNINGYYDKLTEFMRNAMDNNFLFDDCFSLYKMCGSVSEIFEYIDGYKTEGIKDEEEILKKK